VAPAKEFLDRVSGRKTGAGHDGQIYWGAVPFVLIQIVMVGLIIAFPNIVSGGLATRAKVDTQNIRIETPAEGTTSGGSSSEQDDATKALEKEMGGGAERKRPRLRPKKRRSGAGNKEVGLATSKEIEGDVALAPPSQPSPSRGKGKKKRRACDFLGARRVPAVPLPGPELALCLLLRHPLRGDHEVVELVSATANHSTCSLRNFCHGS